MDEAFLTLDHGMAAALAGHSPRQTQGTPRRHPHKWTIQQIVEHLRLTYRSTVEVFDRRIKRGTPTLARPSLSQHLARTVICTCGYFPGGWKAPPAVSPPPPESLRSGEDLLRFFHQDLDALDQAAARAEALFGTRRAITHQQLGPLSVLEWRRFHLVHGRHHLRQILALGRRAT